MEDGTCLSRATLTSGLRSRYTLDLWRKKRPMIDRYISVCMERCSKKRVVAVEDAFLRKLLDGKGSAADYIFWLTNRAPQMWQDRRALIGNVNVNTKINSDNRSVRFERCSDEELRAIINHAKKA